MSSSGSSRLPSYLVGGLSVLGLLCLGESVWLNAPLCRRDEGRRPEALPPYSSCCWLYSCSPDLSALGLLCLDDTVEDGPASLFALLCKRDDDGRAEGVPL